MTLAVAACSFVGAACYPNAKPQTPPRPVEYSDYLPPMQGSGEKPARSEIQIDAVTGRITGDLRVPKKTLTRISLAHINPFLFQYRVKLTATAVLETAQLDFLRIVFAGVPLPETPKPPVLVLNPTSQPAEQLKFVQEEPTKKPPAPRCPEGIYVDVTARYTLLHERKIAIDDAFKEASKTLADQNSALDRASAPVYADTSHTWTVVTSAKAGATEAHKLAEMAEGIAKARKAEVDVFAQLVKDYSAATQPLVAIYPACEAFIKLRGATSEFAVDSGVFRTNVTTIADGAKAAKGIEVLFTEGLRDKKSFYWTYDIGDFDDAQQVQLIVERRKVKTETEYRPIANTTLHYGGSQRLAVGGGFSVVGMGAYTFDGVTTRVTPPDARPGDSLQTVVGMTADSRRRVSPMIVLSTRLLSNRLLATDQISALHAALGVTARTQGGDLNMEYFAGPAISAFNNYLFFSTGWYVGRFTELSGVQLGDRLPGPNAKVPTATRTRTEFPAFMVSFRFR